MYCSDCKNTGTQICTVCCAYQGVPDRWEPKLITNYERLIQKAPEEMAEFISGKARTFGEEYEGYMSALDWLKQEAGE